MARFFATLMMIVLLPIFTVSACVEDMLKGEPQTQQAVEQPGLQVIVE